MKCKKKKITIKILFTVNSLEKLFIKKEPLILLNLNLHLICKSESAKPNCRLLDLEPLKHSIAERTIAKNTSALIQDIALE